jgi:hypothetical protein
MNVGEDHLKAAPRASAPPGTLAVGIGAFALLELALAVFTAVAPHAFYIAIGPFGSFNSHYLRDVASFEGAMGLALAAAVRHPGWRVPVLALTTVQFALHSANHLLDIGRAHPRFTGYFDFFSLAAATVMLARLWRAAGREAAHREHPAGARATSVPAPLSPTPGRSIP